MVPFHNKKTRQLEVQLIIGYQGLEELAYRSGKVAAITATTVHENDEYRYSEGLSPILEHVPSSRGDRGEIVAAYAIAQMISGAKVHAWLWRAEIDKVRSGSQAGGGGPWVTHFAEMAKKTAIRRLAKLLPVAVIQQAAVLQEQADMGLPQSFAFGRGTSGEVLDISAPAIESESESEEPIDTALFEESAKRLKKATKIGECDDIAADYADYPPATANHIKGLCDSKAEAIRGSRGPRSNKKAEPEASGPFPEVAASDALKRKLAAMAAFASREQLVKIEDQAAAAVDTGDLLPADREAVLAACQRRLKDMAATPETE